MQSKLLAALAGLLLVVAAGTANGATIYGLKSKDAPAPSAPPTRLFSFSDDATGFTSIANVTLGGADIDADALAISPTFGLRAFRVGIGGSLSSQLLSVNPSTGVTTTIGSVHTGRDIRGAMFDQFDTLWALDAAANSLLRINPSTGGVISETGLSIDLHTGTDLARAADGTVFLVNLDPTVNLPYGRPRFYTLDLTTASLGLVFTDLADDPLGGVPVFYAGLAAGSGPTASTLFGYEVNWTDDVFTYDLPGFSSRSRVFYNIISDYNAGRGDLASLTPLAPVPEPASLLLLGSGVAALAALRRRRRP